MKRIYHLRAQKDFKRVFRYGKRIESPFFRMSYITGTESHPRFAFVVPKTVSKKAVVRNTLRRRAREWARTRVLLSLSPLDIVVFFKKDALEISRKQLYGELSKQFSGMATHIARRT